jgi:predicted nuclease with TOPRIM domain
MTVSFRESTDDASVLRQELVTVQKMMDELTMAKERDLSSLRGQFEAVKVEKEALEKSLTSGQADLAERLAALQAERTGLVETEKKLRSKVDSVQTELDTKEQECHSLTKNLNEV